MSDGARGGGGRGGGSGSEPLDPGARGDAGDLEREPFRIRDHIGMILGVILGGLAVLAVVVLAVLGFEPAIGLLVVVVVGLALIALGTRLRG